jgi:uncharacterized membrane protein/protein-disulfide isomerase
MPSVFLILIRLLTAVAFAISGYLLYGSLSGERLPGCGLESGCDAVLRTRWAHFFGVPVSLPALLLYLAVFCATFVANARPSLWQKTESFLVCAATALATAAVYFVSLQLFVIGSICKFCMTAHACGFLAGIIILKNAFSGEIYSPDGSAATDSTTRSAAQPKLIFFGLLMVGVLAAGQILHRPRTFRVLSAAGLASRKAPRVLELHGQAFQLDLGDTPLRGSPDAPCVIVQLFDYTCPHCRQFHPILKKACEALSNQVVVASLLVPLATNCNRLVKRPLPQHLTACDLAHAGLALWRSNPNKLDDFEEWIFSGPKPPSPEEVKAKAMQLVGTNEFNKALADPWIPQHLARNINLYETNYVRFRQQILPELMIGTNIISGTVGMADEFYKLLAAQYKLQLPSP